MRPLLSGKILFVFSDPGGAKPCLSLAEENDLLDATIISDREYSFYRDFKTRVTIVSKDYEKYIETVNPSLVFTGTSYTSDIEKQVIKICLKNNIPCYSFVDHWTPVGNRFKDEKGVIVLPDQIWVVDTRAKQIAISEGINEKKIVVTGNPYHDWLKRWMPSVNKENYFKAIGLPDQNKKILVYAPDPLSNINGKEKHGFDEITATTTLVDLFILNEETLKNWKVLVKAHPNQNREKLKSIISECSSFNMLVEDVDTNNVIYYADVVMGFFSSILSEASIMRKPVLRFLDSGISNDPIAELNIGQVVDKNSFIRILTEQLQWN